VAYGALPKAERARRHAAYADWLQGEDASDGVAGKLAYHYAEAVEPAIADLAWRDRDQDAARLRASALRWVRRAAELALSRFDLDDALGLLERAAELTPGDAELWHSIARVNALKFDGTAFWESMQKTLELTTGEAERGELYAELSFESTMRGAMWKVAPDWAMVSGWIGQALEHAPRDSRAYAYALVGKSMLEDDITAAERAIAIAERLDDVELLSFGLSAHSANAQSIADFATAAESELRRLGLVPRITDPDHLALIHWGSATAKLGLGQLDDAEHHALRHEAIAARLTPHHEVHAIGNLVTLDEAAGRWDRLHERTEWSERAVAANADTPCVYNPRNLLACAVACAALGLDDEARRLEAEESALGFEGYDFWLDPLRARLALIRGELDRVEALLAGSEKWSWQVYNFVSSIATRLDALVAVGRAEDAVEDAERYAIPGTYLEPFALRTLGIARGDSALVAQAQTCFEAMGLYWYAG
jgi:hypothetical protein